MDFGEGSQFNSWHNSLCSTPGIKTCTARSLCLCPGLCLGEEPVDSQPTLCSTARWGGCSLCPSRTQTFHKSQPLSGSSDSCAAEGEAAAAQEHQGIFWVGEESQRAGMAPAASLDRIPSLSALKILTRHWAQAETSGIVEGHCLNGCCKAMCDVLAVLTTFTWICESNADAVVPPLWQKWPSNPSQPIQSEILTCGLRQGEYANILSSCRELNYLYST